MNIVDNSVTGWTGLRYLQEWADIARAFDVATEFFEIGALLALVDAGGSEPVSSPRCGYCPSSAAQRTRGIS